MSNAEIVKYIYAKFTHGDAHSILTTFAPDVEFPPCRGAPLSAVRAALVRQGRRHPALLHRSRSRVGLVHCTRQRTRSGGYRGGGRPIPGRLQADRQGARRPDMSRVEVQERRGQKFPPIRRHGADPGGDDTQLTVARACIGSTHDIANGRTRLPGCHFISVRRSGRGWHCAFAALPAYSAQRMSAMGWTRFAPLRRFRL